MKIALTALTAAAWLIASTAHAAQPPLCKPDISSWPSNYHTDPECRYHFTSPASDLAVDFDFEGRYVLVDHGDAIYLGVQGSPSQFSWAPGGRYFYINDELGDGLDSELHLFDLGGGGVVDKLTIRRDLHRLYAARTRCRIKDAEPTTWGLGWSKDATQLYVLLQALPEAYCLQDSDFYVATVALPSGKIVAFDPAPAARRKFRAMLPQNMLKP